jgi:RHS repeat-associated protein
VKYVHTDALGSVVAITDAARNVIERREYEPYGQQLTPAVQDGPGYTGHVQDAATGLTYMQQRYYDPQIGLFLSVDPVTALDNPMGMFHRYRYAANNPYKFTDPDGRCYTSTGECLTDEQVDDVMANEPSRVLNTIGSPLGTVADLANGDAKGAVFGAVASRVPGGKLAQSGLGVVYKRINPHTLATYIGKAKNMLRYLRRQAEHDKKKGVKHRYEVLGRAEGDKATRALEETEIRSNGGPQSKGGTLENKISAMSEKNYKEFQGTFRVEGRIDSRRLDESLD